MAGGTILVVSSVPNGDAAAGGALGLGPGIHVSLSMLAGKLCTRKCTTLSFSFGGKGAVGGPFSVCRCGSSASDCRGLEDSAKDVSMGS